MLFAFEAAQGKNFGRLGGALGMAARRHVAGTRMSHFISSQSFAENRRVPSKRHHPIHIGGCDCVSKIEMWSLLRSNAVLRHLRFPLEYEDRKRS